MKGNTFSSHPHAALGRELGTVRVFMLECAAKLATLNSKIPSLYGVV